MFNLTVRTNLRDLDQRMMRRIAAYRDPPARPITNRKVYAHWIEAGGTKRYVVPGKLSARRRRLMGTRTLPKGGAVSRSRHLTVVKQPGRHMIGGSQRILRAIVRGYFMRNKPYSYTDLVLGQKYARDTALALFRVKTPGRGPLYRDWS